MEENVKTPGRERASVDIDPVRPQIRHAYRHVAVDDNRSNGCSWARNSSRIHSRSSSVCSWMGTPGRMPMDKQEIPATEREIERFPKLEGALWGWLCQFFGEPSLFRVARLERY